MAANERSLRITDLYRQRLILLRDRIRGQVVFSWGQVRVEDLDRTHAAWLIDAVARVEQGQRAGVRLTAAYLAAYVASETGRRPVLPRVDETAYVGAEDGRDMAAPLAATLIGVKTLLKQDKPVDLALRAGQARAGRLASTSLMTAPRAALADTVRANDTFTGWRRVAKPGACLACLAQVGKILRSDQPLRFHDSCSCTAEPVVASVPDTAHRPSGLEMFNAMPTVEQDQRYGEKAELLRTGQASLRDFIDRSPMALVPDRLTEAPLHAVAN